MSITLFTFRITIVALIATGLASTSCTTVIDLDTPEHEPMWTFSGNIVAGERSYEYPVNRSNIEISNFFSHGNNDNQFTLTKTIPATNRNLTQPFYDDGELLIFKDEDFIESAAVFDDAYYLSTHEFQPEDTYLLEMTTIDGIVLSASQTIPRKVVARNVTFEESSTEYIVRFTFDDPQGINYYLFQTTMIHFYASGGLESYLEFNIPSPDFFWYYENFEFGEDQNQYWRVVVLSDAAFDGQSHEVELRVRRDPNFESLEINKKLIVEINSMSLDMPRYIQTFSQGLSSFGPFSEPVILNFNVENGLAAIVATTTTFLEIDL